MAGHYRSTGTGRSYKTQQGKRRRVREHVPAGEAVERARGRAHRSARSKADQRIRRSSDPLAQLEAARDYVRSAAAKYQPSAELTDAVQALLAAGDRLYQQGQPLTAAQRNTRRQQAQQHRARRETDAVLRREGEKAVRQQQRAVQV